MMMLQQSMGRLKNSKFGSSTCSKKLLDININFDSERPTITYTYFDKDNKTEIVETYNAYSLCIKEDLSYNEYTLSGRKDFFDRTFEIRDMFLLKTEINKL